MIRKWHSENTAQLLRLWLESTTEAHPFIDAGYWKANEALVRDEYLPAAETWVWEENGTLRGFISVMQSQFVGALFVAPAFIGRGIGRALLNHVQQRYPYLTLEVYQKNVRAVNFYHAQGFRIEDSAWQDDTQHPTWIMSWQADQTP
ncbi:N-acetyltransferase [Enterobacter genomosp. S]|uniref:Acetyltransferase n=1 Tax=Enterobacter genomosp. S TaxID=2364151 RepID=A0ABR5YID0_9ENTR|nr:N-acetyltransferase [Enterobacter genomosp. S]KZR29822.1 acetyltransferase [Enterobacter genomosp. S]